MRMVEIETSTLLFICAAVVVVSALITILLILLFRPKEYDEDDIKDIIYESMQSGRLARLVEDKIRAELSHRKLESESAVANKPVETPRPEQKPAEVVETPKAEIADTPKPVEESTEPKEITLPTPITLFAGVCVDGKFKRIESTPNEKSIYIIWASDKDSAEGIISIDQNAYEKVANTPDYLNDACVVSGSGSNVKEVHAGSVVKTNGQWVIKEPIEVELY